MIISLSKDYNSKNAEETKVHVKVSADDDYLAQLVDSHSFNLERIQTGRSVAVNVFDSIPHSRQLRKYGKLLFLALFSEMEWSPARCLLQVILPPQSKGRILLNLNGDDDLDLIPWEYAWGNNAYLTSQCVFVRQRFQRGEEKRDAKAFKSEAKRLFHWSRPQSKLPRLPLRIVTVIPDPIVPPYDQNAFKFPDLNLSDQFQAFCNQFQQNNRMVLLESVFPPTVDQMYVQLRRKPEMATVLHFMGHCSWRYNVDGEVALIFEDHETGGLNFVDTLHLDATMNLRLAFLLSCDTRSIARALAGNGIPYTIGSHCPIPDDLARKFECIFYRSLGSGCSVEKAMLEARAFMYDTSDIRQRDFLLGALVLYSSTFLEEDGMFKCMEGKPTIDAHMHPHNLEEISVTRFLCGRKEYLIKLTHVLKRMANRGTQTCPLYTIVGIAGQGKTALAEVAVRRTAYLFPGGIFVWRFDPSNEISIIKYLQRLYQVLFQKDFGNDFHTLEQSVVMKFRSHPTCLLILDQADILKRAQVEGDMGAVALVDWLLKIISMRGMSVKCLATSRQCLSWIAEEDTMYLDGLTDSDIESGIELFIGNLNTQVIQRIEREKNTMQLLQALVRSVDGHPLCLKSLAHAVCLPQHLNISLEELVHEHYSTFLVNGPNRSTNLDTLFRSTINTLPMQECQFLYICSLFTGPITEEVLEFVRHFVKYVDTSKGGIDANEKVAGNLQLLYGRGLLSKKYTGEYYMHFVLREGAKLCNSILKLRLCLPIPCLFDDTFVIGIVGPSPQEKSIVLEWQLRRIQANAHRKPQTRGFGIDYYSIGNAGLRIFNIPGINDQDPAKAAEQSHASFRRLVAFVYNISEGDHDSFQQLCTDQIIPLVQEKQLTFILCLNHTDEMFGRKTASLLSKKAAEILRSYLEKTHWIVRTETPLRNVQARGEVYVSSASNENRIHDYTTVEMIYRKSNDNVRMEGPFIGRTKDLENLTKLLQGTERYITVKGFGGVGKTSLALQAFNQYNSGSALALSLAGAPRSSQVILKIAEFFAINTKGSSDQEQQDEVLRELERKNAILLFLDNMEGIKHAMQSGESEANEGARLWINFFKGLPANVKILATSRVALGWPKEHIFDLDGLEPREGMLVFQQWTTQRSEAGETGHQSEMDLSCVTDGHPLSLRLLGGMFDNRKEPIQQFVNEVCEQLSVAINEEFIYRRHKTINACIKYSFDHLDDTLQSLLWQLRDWNVPFTSKLVIRTLDRDPATSPVETNLHKLWQIGWLNRRKYDVDPMLGDWRPTIIENATEFYSLHPLLHEFLHNRFDNIEAPLPDDAEIQFYTALCFGVGFGVANDQAEQIEWCTKAATKGHLEAQLTLAACYQGGCGVGQNAKKALDLLLNAAEAGCKQAQSEVALFYREGYGVVKDLERATFWEKEAEGHKTASLLIKFDLSLPLIHRAVKGGDVAIVRTLCTKNISGDVIVRDRMGRTPLHVATHTGHIDLIEFLLYECKADKSPDDLYGNTPLHIAADSGRTEVVWMFVIDFGMDPDPKNHSGWTPLHCAANEGHLEVVKLLLADTKAGANAKTNDGWTPLHLATSKGHVDIMRLLLANSKTDANAKTDDGWTPLHWATYKGHVDIVKLLLADSKVDANAKTNDGWTSLHWASSEGHVEVVKELLFYFKADANAKTNDGWTPLHWAAQRGHVEVVKVFLGDSMTYASVKTDDGWTPLHWAAQRGHVEVVNVDLCGSMTDANAKTNDGWTPLHCASSKGHIDIVKLLLANAKADVDARNNVLQTPIHQAAQNGHLEAVRILVTDFGADANVKDHYGSTPLLLASQFGHVKIMKLLGKEVANVEGRTLTESLKQDTTLTVLNLKCNGIGNSGAHALAEFLRQNTTVTSLYLQGNGIDDEGARALSESVKQNTTVTVLNLDYNRISYDGARALAESLKQNKTVTTLNLQDNEIGDIGASALAESLEQNTVVTTLNLQANGIGVKGSLALAASLKQNTTVTSLNLDCNGIGDEGASSLAESLKLNTTVTMLNLKDNSIGDETLGIIRTFLERNAFFVESKSNLSASSKLLLVQILDANKISDTSIMSKFKHDFSSDDKLAECLKMLQIAELAPCLTWIPFRELTVVEKLGEGGFGIVYKAEVKDNRKRRRFVALKRLKGSNYGIEQLRNEVLVNVYLRSINKSGRLSTPAVLGLSRDVATGCYIMVMEYAAGGNLTQHLKNSPPNSWWTIWLIAIEITRRLQVIHNADLIHNDLHPGNIVFLGKEDLNPMIIDVGICNTVQHFSKHGGQILGRIEYLPPEVFEENSPCTKKSDIYCLGTLLWQLTSKYCPRGNAVCPPVATSNGLREEPVPGTPSEYSDIYKKCWNPDPEMRPTIEEVLKDLESIESDIAGDEWLGDNSEAMTHLEKIQTEIASRPSFMFVDGHTSKYYTKAELKRLRE